MTIYALYVKLTVYVSGKTRLVVNGFETLFLLQLYSSRLFSRRVFQNNGQQQTRFYDAKNSQTGILFCY